ncbi:bifunctional 5,10-methylenetetrahydrofolate dehydrogenase/5,10-methenyltetrahydrofolate cyclohydrolase [bacterium]|nr:MAG: bifunctional 5,10-methylenetetrahydrofolate dehydrogenase/5,10-methenyltetrahydrofolate cyclohydrolase [bacterium]
MKLLNGRELALFLQNRHASLVAGMTVPPRLAIIRSQDNIAADKYLRAKSIYGAAIGAKVDVYSEAPADIIRRIKSLGDDPAVTGIIVQLPLPDDDLTNQALAAVPASKDVDGLGHNSPFEATTPKAVLWLLAAYDVPVQGKIAVVGQGRLIGKPLADRLEAAGHNVLRCDIRTIDLANVLGDADMLFSATGQAHLITTHMIKTGAVVVDAGSPAPEFEPAVYDRSDLILTPNPGGVGPMTVACLFDNLLIASQRRQS